MKKKIIIPIVVIAIVVIAIIVGIVITKGNNDNTKEVAKEEHYYKIGDTISTDIAEFKLNDCKLAIELSNRIDDTYFTPKEYNIEDAGNPYIAGTGHTFVYLDFTVSAIDRSQIELNGFSNSDFVSVKYKDNNYYTNSSNTMKIGMRKIENTVTVNKKVTGKWEKHSSQNILLQPSEKEEYRAYVDIDVNVDSLNDTFYITFKLPNSENKTTSFTYVINE